jgi:hypothetical protein
MYASGLMSRHTPICAVAGAADTTNATKEMAIRILQSLAFLIGDQLYSDDASLDATSNNIKYALHVKRAHTFGLNLVVKMIYNAGQGKIP